MRLKFRLPLHAILPACFAFLMAWVFVVAFNWLGFTHCLPWAALQRPPAKVTRFVDAFGDRIYLQTTNNAVYCYKQNQWTDCLLPHYSAKLNNAPDWLISNFVVIPAQGTILQLIRANKFLDTIYYALSETGDVWACSATVETQITAMFRSGAIVLLVIPFGTACWCFASFLKILAENADPTYADFFGRRTKIK